METKPLESPPQPQQQAVVAATKDTSSDYPWEAWAELITACLIIPKTLPDLIDLWKSNEAMLDWASKVKPETYGNVKDAFTRRKIEIQKGEQ